MISPHLSTRQIRMLALLVCAGAAAILIALWPGSARADATVAGSQYSVTFLGQGSADWNDPGTANDNFDNKGTFTIQDNPVVLWFPASHDPGEEGAAPGADASSTDSPFDLQTASNTSDPANLSETGVSGGDSYSCSGTSIYDDGMSWVEADVTLGSVVLSTTSDSMFSRNWDDNPGGPPDTTSCSGPGSTGGGMWFFYPDDGPDGDGGEVNYAATVPYSDVGQASFSLPVTDQSTINQAPSWNGVEGTHTFSVSGDYTFTKVCDGSIDYTSDGEVLGTCAGGGSGAGGGGNPGAGGNGGGTQPPVIVEPPAGSASGGGGSAKASKNGTVTVGTAKCAGPKPCSVGATLTSSGASKSSVAAFAKKRKVQTYARRKVKVPAGKKRPIVVTLSKKAKALLHKAHKLKTKATIVITSPGEKTVTKRFSLTIRSGKR